MRAAVFAAFPDDGGGAPVAPQSDRQLHLVFEAEGGSSDLPVPRVPPVEEVAASERNDMVAAVAGTAVAGSLAEYALGLRAGDPCFCCGRPLETFAPAREEAAGRSLHCVECGATVFGPK